MIHVFSVSYRFHVIDKGADDGSGAGEQKYCSHHSGSKAHEKIDFDGVFHAFIVLAGIIIANERQDTLRHACGNNA